MKFFISFFWVIFCYAQQHNYVDFIKCNASVQLNEESKSVSGEVLYTFKVLQPMDTIKIDAKNMVISSVTINKKPVKYFYNGKFLAFYDGYKKGKNSIQIKYTATPKQTLYFIGEKDNLQIWTQGQGKYTSHWLPSFDDVNEKVIFNLNVTFLNDYEIISNGKLIKSEAKSNTQKINFFTMQKPMSSYLVMLAVGKFIKKSEKTKSKTSLEFYLSKNDINKFEPTFRYSKKIFNYFEEEIGIKYPWQIYRQIPIRDFLYAGMENTTSTLFSQDFVVDEIGFNDRNYINVNAHELAHQWFGNLITAKSGKDHWLQEGFATYYALLAEKEIFGEDYYFNELYDYALQLKEATKTDTIPILNEKASSLSFYKKGAWALHALNKDLGNANFKKIVKNYLKKHQFKNVTTQDFIKEILKVCPNYNVNGWKNSWLNSTSFYFDLAESYLAENKSIKDLFTYQNSNKSIKNIEELINSTVYPSVKQWAIYDMYNIPYQEKKTVIQNAMKLDLLTRRAVAETVTEIPLDFKTDYETLLKDNSYVTNEIALINLCKNFPSYAKIYLENTKYIVGNNNKSFRITWLKTVFTTFFYSKEQREKFYNELVSYTTPLYESSVRQNALQALIELYKFDDDVIENLFLATQHHKWQFAKFARDNIKNLIKIKSFRDKAESYIKNNSINYNVNEIITKYLREN